MSKSVNRLAITMVLGIVFAIILAGCKSGPVDTPVGQRAPGQDISSTDRADKRGDIPAAPGKK